MCAVVLHSTCTYPSVKRLHRRHVPEQRLWECEEAILLDIHDRDTGCPREMESVVIQAVQVALFDVTGGMCGGFC